MRCEIKDWVPIADRLRSVWMVSRSQPIVVDAQKRIGFYHYEC